MLLYINYKHNNATPLYLNPRDKIQWWREQGAGADMALHGLPKCIIRKAAWMLQGGVCWRAYSQKLILAPEGGIGCPETPGAAPHVTNTPNSQSDLLDGCERRELGGGSGKSGGIAEFHHQFTQNQRFLHIETKETLAEIYSLT